MTRSANDDDPILPRFYSFDPRSPLSHHVLQITSTLMQHCIPLFLFPSDNATNQKSNAFERFDPSHTKGQCRVPVCSSECRKVRVGSSRRRGFQPSGGPWSVGYRKLIVVDLER